MGINEIAATVVGIIGALGGFEALKWLLNRKSNAREANPTEVIEG